MLSPALIHVRFTAVAVATAMALIAQQPRPGGGPGGQGSELVRQAVQLDNDGKYAEARQLLQKAIDTAPTASAKASAQRAMAMSWAFAGDCRKVTCGREYGEFGFGESAEGE